MREFLEKEWAADLDDAAAIRLCVKALLEVVDSGANNMEVVVLTRAADGAQQCENQRPCGHEAATSRPRRRRDSSPRAIHVASPRLDQLSERV